jgi:hypothetical protein
MYEKLILIEKTKAEGIIFGFLSILNFIVINQRCYYLLK